MNAQIVGDLGFFHPPIILGTVWRTFGIQDITKALFLPRKAFHDHTSCLIFWWENFWDCYREREREKGFEWENSWGLCLRETNQLSQKILSNYTQMIHIHQMVFIHESTLSPHLPGEIFTQGKILNEIERGNSMDSFLLKRLSPVPKNGIKCDSPLTV